MQLTGVNREEQLRSLSFLIKNTCKMKTLKRILLVGSSIGIFLLAGYGTFKNVTDPSFAANPIDKDYEWEDLSHPYFERIRNDERLVHFYEKDLWLFEDVLEVKEFLRDAFPHGKPPKNYKQKNVLEMLDAAEDGAKFLCSGSAKMMAQLLMAADIPTRIVRLSDEKGHGHIVLEFWSEEYKKWCLIDIDYNLHYTDMNGKPLCAKNMSEFLKILFSMIKQDCMKIFIRKDLELIFIINGFPKITRVLRQRLLP